MADDVVDHVGLGGVLRLGTVAEVLGAGHLAVGKVRKEFAEFDEAFGGDEAETVQVVEAAGEGAEIGEAVVIKADLLAAMEIDSPGAALLVFFEAVDDESPDGVFVGGVADVGHVVAGEAGFASGVEKECAAIDVGVVVDAGMLGVEFEGGRAAVGKKTMWIVSRRGHEFTPMRADYC